MNDRDPYTLDYQSYEFESSSIVHAECFVENLFAWCVLSEAEIARKTPKMSFQRFVRCHEVVMSLGVFQKTDTSRYEGK